MTRLEQAKELAKNTRDKIVQSIIDNVVPKIESTKQAYQENIDPKLKEYITVIVAYSNLAVENSKDFNQNVGKPILLKTINVTYSYVLQAVQSAHETKEKIPEHSRKFANQQLLPALEKMRNYLLTMRSTTNLAIRGYALSRNPSLKNMNNQKFFDVSANFALLNGTAVTTVVFSMMISKMLREMANISFSALDVAYNLSQYCVDHTLVAGSNRADEVYDYAKQFFLMLLPVSAAVVTYHYLTMKPTKELPPDSPVTEFKSTNNQPMIEEISVQQEEKQINLEQDPREEQKQADQELADQEQPVQEQQQEEDSAIFDEQDQSIISKKLTTEEDESESYEVINGFFNVGARESFDKQQEENQSTDDQKEQSAELMPKPPASNSPFARVE